MILGPQILLKLVKDINLVEGLCERELTNPEGAGFDLRLDEVYEISGEGYIGDTHRQTPNIKLIKKYKEGKVDSIIVKPNEFYLFKTIESFNMPDYLTANFKPRTSTFRSGLFLRTGNVAPGYAGPVTFGIKNEGPCNVKIELGARFVHVQFEEVAGKGNMYRGQWQHGRVSATKKEKQV